MSKSLILLAAVAASLGLAGCAQPGTPASAPSVATPAAAPALTAQGYDTIRIGATPVEAGYGLADNGAYRDACRIHTSPRLPGLAALVEDGRIRRVTLFSGPAGRSPIRTDRGIGLGSTEAEVRAAYRPVGQQPHKYVPAPAKNLFHGEEGVPQALRFEIGQDGRVTHIHAGESPQLQYAEGCS